MGLLSDLSDYLENAAGQGRRHSSGAFTLDPARARELLAHFRLRGPEDCLLKWVQAAVVARASEIRVTLGRRQTSLLASGCKLPLQGSEIQHFLGRPLDRSPSAARHLAVGLLSAWKGYPAHLSLEWTEEERAHRLDFRGAEVTSSDSDSLQEGQFRVEWQRRLSGGFWERFRRFLKGQLQEHTALRACRYAVAPVLVDALPLAREQSSTGRVTAGGQLGEHKSNFPLLVAYYPASAQQPGALLTDLPRAAYHGRKLTRTSASVVAAGILTTASPGPLKGHYPPAGPRGEAMWLRLEVRAALTGTGRICFVHNGVLIQEYLLNLGVPGALVWASADGLTTDLSEFTLVDDEALRRRCAAIQACLRETLNTSAEQLRELLRDYPNLFRRLQAHVPALRSFEVPRRKSRQPQRPHDETLPPPPRTLKPNDRRPR